MYSWSMLKQIIRAYGQVQDVEKPTVEDVAKIASLQRSVVSANNNFLREIGIISKEENKPTPLGAKLADILVMENDALISEALQEVVRGNPSLNRWVGMIRARGSMKFEHFKGTIGLASGITDKGKQSIPAKALLDLLQEAKLIQVNDDTIKPCAVDSSERPSEEVQITERLLNAQNRRGDPSLPREVGTPKIPLPLGQSRLAYLQLPEDWNARELPKLIKLLQIALGDDPEGT
jgi:hypothetical protein